ncbi:hypothetical protein L1049_012440 [Liquidambar formosana]|uniref:RNase H type-1 domain-containing protein n=1 Tax=Liquidambar formosana TaxID=63359 RepID=A0AAP0N7A8_LIQFO
MFNNLMFNNVRANWEDVAELAKRRTAFWVKALRSELGYSIADFLSCIDGVRAFRSTKLRPKCPTLWKSPPSTTLKFNVDGSAKGKPGPGGIGGVLRDDSGGVIYLFSIPVGIVDSNFAELLAVREALRLFSTSVWASSKNLLIESDSTLVVSWINGHVRVWKFQFVLNEIFSLINHLRNVVISHEFREANCMADWLAKDGVGRLAPSIAWL